MSFNGPLKCLVAYDMEDPTHWNWPTCKGNIYFSHPHK